MIPDFHPPVTNASLMQSEYRMVRAITGYNRLEPSPRTNNFDRSLRGEIRDALWMLTRQWQFGEFQGEDAASPFTAQILGEHTKVDRIGFPDGKILSYDENIPLETKVEREKLTASLFLAVQMGRYFLKLMRSKSLSNFLTAFLEKYKLNYTIDKNDKEGVQLLKAVQGKIFDGFLLYSDIVAVSEGTSEFGKWIKEAAADHQDQFTEIAENFKNWYNRNYNQPESISDSCWKPEQLEYQFALGSSSQAQTTMVADQYSESHLDWYSFDLNSAQQLSSNSGLSSDNVITENYVSFIPTSVSFKGMPNPRFWMMEESQINFGKIDTSATGLLHLLLAEFGLIYSNDWFILPYPLSINNLCEIKNLVITDVFGQHILIRPAGKGSESQWQRWAMFHQTNKSDTGSNTNLFYLAPSLTKSLESDPLEKVNFLRDEMANMVWAVENIVPSQAGKGVDGNEMALKKNSQEQFVSDNNASIRYVLGTTVPDNWIPFIPVHIPGSNSEIRLQRAQLPGAKGAAGVLLKEQQPVYFINEEEVPRSGVIVQRSFQRTRWLNGKTFLWIGRDKKAGKGEGWSNLKFDQIEPIENKSE